MNDLNKRAFLGRLAGVSAGIAAAAAIPAAIAGTGTTSESRLARRTGLLSGDERRRQRFPNVSLIDQDGNILRFYDDMVKGKTVLINFMYTRCNGTCPGTTANLRKAQAEFGDRMGRDVFMYSISLEPEYDTPERLKAYADLFKVKPGWRFITGAKDSLDLIRREFGFYRTDPKLDKRTDSHVGAVKFGIERLQRWGMCAAQSNPKYIARYVEWLEPKGKRPDLGAMMG
jgi:protein SCO1/2